jgi:hypothetical protein
MKKFIKFFRGLIPFVYIYIILAIIIFIIVMWKFTLIIEDSSFTAKTFSYLGEFLAAFFASFILVVIIALSWALIMLILMSVTIVTEFLRLTLITKIIDYLLEKQSKVIKWLIGEDLHKVIFK